jgi:hypothetical protein
MKLKYLFTLLAMLVSASVLAQSPADAFPRDTFSGSSTTAGGGGNFGTTNYWYVVPADSNGGEPRIQFLSFRNDKAAGNFTFYTPWTNRVAQITNAAGSTNLVIITSTNNNFLADDWCVVQFNGFKPPRYQFLQITNVSTFTIKFNSNFTHTAASGDSLWRVLPVGSTRQGNTTNTLAPATAIFSGKRNEPIAILMDSTTVAGLDAVSGVYFKP